IEQQELGGHPKQGYAFRAQRGLTGAEGDLRQAYHQHEIGYHPHHALAWRMGHGSRDQATDQYPGNTDSQKRQRRTVAVATALHRVLLHLGHALRGTQSSSARLSNAIVAWAAAPPERISAATQMASMISCRVAP